MFIRSHKKLTFYIIGAKRPGSRGETTRLNFRGETTRGETTRGGGGGGGNGLGAKRLFAI